MNQVIHIFRKDVQHWWKEIAVSLTLLAVYVWSEPATWVSGAAGLSGFATRSSIAELVTELLPISWWLLVLRVVQDEALVGDRQFWVTRPYEWKKLLAAKVLFGAAFVSVPLLLAQFSLLQLAGFPPTLARLRCQGEPASCFSPGHLRAGGTSLGEGDHAIDHGA